jgi:ADP-ribosylglycohydrolase
MANLDKIKGLIYGSALGDCYGSRVDGQTKESLMSRYPDGLHEILNWKFHNIEPGDWSCETDHLLLLLEVLTENNNKVNIQSYASKIKKWRFNGFSEVYDDCGVGISQLLTLITNNDSYIKDPISYAIYANKNSVYGQTNGSLVRNGICAFTKMYTANSILQSKISHVDQRCLWSCAILSHIIYNLSIGKIITLDQIKKFSTNYIGDTFDIYFQELDKDLDHVFDKIEIDEGQKNFVYNSLFCALYALKHIIIFGENVDFIKVLSNVLLKGGATNVNCALAGQIVGAYIGYSKLPKSWLDCLKNTDVLIESRIKKYLNMLSKLEN